VERAAILYERGGKWHRSALERSEQGYHEGLIEDIGDGTRYFIEADGRGLPDPCSPFQPEGVHGPSMLVDLSGFEWTDRTWQGIGLRDAVIYELHIGTFTSQGDYLSAIDRLDELVALGITVVELLPVAQCPGAWNWGYDGVGLFAPNHNYGSPADLCRLIDTCHARGLAVVHDVVYNHLGPEGNYLGAFGPYFAERPSPWGEAPAFDQKSRAAVREFARSNAHYWIEQYHFDGLRFDAIGAIEEAGSPHIINQIGTDLKQYAKETGREVLLFGESNFYQPEFLPEEGGTLDAIWSDDLCHAANASVGPHGLHGGRSYRGIEDYEECLEQGYLYRRADDGSLRRVKEPTRGWIERCVNQIQNHDTVGNSPGGQRLHQIASKQAQRSLAGLCLLYPAIPLIFMGEEFAAPTPFHFFTDFEDPALRTAVEQGRAQEFAHHDWSDSMSPVDPQAFKGSKLPSQADGDAETLEWYKFLIATRKQWQSAGMLASEALHINRLPDRPALGLEYRGDGTTLGVYSNLGEHTAILTLGLQAKIIGSSGPVSRESRQIQLGPYASVVIHGAAMWAA
jgi:malto-oligosyltrehalose trehalohydrolase